MSAGEINKMEDSSNSKPFMVTSSLNFKVTTPSFYNQPKKFASVAPPRPKSLTPPSAPSPTPVGTGVIGRVGDLPPPPPSLCDGRFLIYPDLSSFWQFSCADSHFKSQRLNVSNNLVIKQLYNLDYNTGLTWMEFLHFNCERQQL